MTNFFFRQYILKKILCFVTYNVGFYTGNELNVVRLWLGHADLNTTHMYIEINMEMKKEILSKTQPPQLKKEIKKWKRPKILEWLDELCKTVELCQV